MTLVDATSSDSVARAVVPAARPPDMDERVAELRRLRQRIAHGPGPATEAQHARGKDLSYAWPTNEIAVMGADGAASVVFRKEIAASEDPEAMRAARVAEYRDQLMHPYYAAERGLVDDVIEPAETRAVLADALRMLRAKDAVLPSRKHGNPPT